jgi:hypothetical protein
MEAVVVLRGLWRHRILVVLSAALAVGVALILAFKVSLPFTFQSRSYEVGIASTTALVDTPTSQVVDLGDSNDNSAGALTGRAALIASLLSTSPLKDEIAKKAGIAPDTLIAGAPGATTPSGETNAPVGSISPKDRRASFLDVQPSEGLPILMVAVQAPDVATASRLSNGAIEVLQTHLSSLAGVDGVPAGRRLVVKQLGAARVGAAQRGPSRVLAAVAGIFLFTLVCAAILVVEWLARNWKRAEALERLSPTDWAILEASAMELAKEADTKPRVEPAPRKRDAPPTPTPPAQDRWDVVR